MVVFEKAETVIYSSQYYALGIARLEKVAILDEETVDRVKEAITTLAIEERWTPEQVQFAEDFIDDLAVDRSTAKPAIELTPKHVEMVRRAVIEARRPVRSRR